MAFEPLTDKAELAKLFEQMLAEAQADVVAQDARDVGAAAHEQATANAQAFQKQLGPVTTAPVQGAATDKNSLWNLRFGKKP